MMKHGRRKRKRKAKFFFWGGGQLLAPVGFFSLKIPIRIHSMPRQMYHEAIVAIIRGNARTHARTHRHIGCMRQGSKKQKNSIKKVPCMHTVFWGGVRVCNAILTFFFRFFLFLLRTEIFNQPRQEGLCASNPSFFMHVLLT